MNDSFFNKILSKARSLKFLFNSNIIIGKNVYFGKSIKLDTSKGGMINIGDNSELHDLVNLLCYGGDIKIGENSSVNPFCVVYGHGGVVIGDFVRIAVQTIIIPANHLYGDLSKKISRQGITKKGILIEDNVWLGANVKILDGVKIGSGAIIGAGAVVNKNVKKNSVYAGVPAKFIKNREDEKK
ncbi:MAG: acyltransferase [Patescibacteria group bacterium]|jgi:acetyltransferase-like isoleucine patch superfamily enzyme|nr:acyltransferase [Patescibacteria group bacterium]